MPTMKKQNKILFLNSSLTKNSLDRIKLFYLIEKPNINETSAH